jgi:SAM-dependent methyltransferase
MPWFKEWFNSRYYHLLYGKRDESEAETFIHNLMGVLQPESNSKFLDLACGKGRHALQIASYGYEVHGVDLSEESINAANLMANDHLVFKVQDMRSVYLPSYFNFIFNLFTSFGYFDQQEDNLLTLKAVRAGLKDGGVFVQDYFNAVKVESAMKAQEIKSIEGIDFEIRKHIDQGVIYKSIKFSDAGQDYQFCEQVNLFQLSDFEAMYKEAGFEITALYGNYQLEPFQTDISDRLIIISKAI